MKKKKKKSRNSVVEFFISSPVALAHYFWILRVFYNFSTNKTLLQFSYSYYLGTPNKLYSQPSAVSFPFTQCMINVRETLYVEKRKRKLAVLTMGKVLTIKNFPLFYTFKTEYVINSLVVHLFVSQTVCWQ